MQCIEKLVKLFLSGYPLGPDSSPNTDALIIIIFNNNKV